MNAGSVLPSRRTAMQAMAAMVALLAPGQALAWVGDATMEEEIPGYGLIGQIFAVSGKRDELAAILARMDGAMPGNFAYLVSEDLGSDNGLWVVEYWTDAAAHRASLALPAVQAAIAEGRPLIAGFGARHEVRPLPRHAA